MKGSAIQPAVGIPATQPDSRSASLQQLATRVAAIASAALGLGAAALDAERPLTALGLDSLAAVEIAAALEADWGTAPPLSLLLAGASCHELARWLQASLRERAAGAPAAPAEGAAGDSREPIPPAKDFPLSPGQQALWFLERLAPTAGAYNVVVAAEARGLDAELLVRLLAILASRHAALRTIFPVHGEQAVQRVLAAPAIDFASQDAAQWSPEQLLQRMAEEAWRPFDLEHGPLLRVRLFEPAPVAGPWRGPLLMVAIHHLVADFWSLRILAQQLRELLEAASPLEAGSPSPWAAATPAPVAGVTAAAPAATFAECARRQAEQLAGQQGQLDWAFWRQTLAGERGAVPDLDLPTDRPRPAVQTWRALARSTALAAPRAAALRRLAAAEGATLFGALAAIWQLQLGRAAGQDDFAVGTPTSGRRAAGSAGVVGYFVNSVALRADLRGAPPVGHLLGRVRRSLVAALEHADFPFAWLAARLRPARDPARPPLYQTVLALEPHRPGDPPGLAAFAQGEQGACLDLGGGVALTAVALPERRAQVELTLSVAELADGGLALALEANADLFDAATVDRMLGHFVTLAAAAAAEPERAVWDLPLLTAAEQEQLQQEWGASLQTPAAADARCRPLHELVAERARRAPAATALVIGDAAWTYGCLVARAHHLAARLRGLLGAPGTPPAAERTVALLVERSADLVAGALGILEAGGTLLALDPEYAMPRLAWTLADAGAAAVITQRRFAARLPDTALPQVLVDQVGAVLERGPGRVAAASVAPTVRAGTAAMDGGDAGDRGDGGDGGGGADPGVPGGPAATGWEPWEGARAAYLVYTSGSTGVPKGVAVSHAAAAHQFLSAARTLALAAGDRVLQLPSTGFDAALEQIFATLLAGSTLVMRGPEPWGPRELADRLATRELTVVDVPVAFLTHWVAAAGQLPAPAPSLRLVMVSGEELRAQTVRRHGASPLAAVPLWNCYGPTEAVVSATLYAVRRQDGDGGPVPIGRALPGRVARVLDRHGQPQPLGAPGELCLGGLLARGYHARPDLTAASFVPDPWGPPGTRLYRTGDLVRRRAPDGLLQFLGRLDQQVKVRGFRVEPGEIAAVLAEHPAVAAAAVLALRAGPAVVPAVPPAPAVPAPLTAPVAPSEATASAMAAVPAAAVVEPEQEQALRLVAFVAPELPPDLAGFVAQRLPGYMVPAVWLALPRLPANAAGKIDQAALAALAPDARPLAAAQDGDASAPPDASRAAIEELLAGAWAALLCRETVGRHQDFFALGGHSLLATRVVAQVSRWFGVDLPLSEVFAAPTVAALAERIAAAVARGSAGGPETAGDPLAGSRPSAAPPLTAGHHDAAHLPLSSAQRRLWFLEQLAPGTALYNIPGALQLSGPLAVPALAAAMASVVRRHQVLRTAIKATAGQPVQRLVEWPATTLPQIDLAALAPAARQGETERLSGAEARQPFDLAQGPLVRALLLRQGPAEHRLLVTFHHLVADGWSLGVFLDQLAELYPLWVARGAQAPLQASQLPQASLPHQESQPPQASQLPQPPLALPASQQPLQAQLPQPPLPSLPALPPLPVQYADFAVWQAAWLAGGEEERQLVYWRSRLAGVPATELPMDRRRPPVRSSRGATRAAALPAAAPAAIAALARREGVTVFMALEGLFQALAGRLSGDDRVAVGTPVANRRRAEVEPLIGLFVNTLVLDVELGDDPSLGDLLARVRQACLGAYAHQDLPFERLVEELQPGRDLARHPLFQLMFVLADPLPARTLDLPPAVAAGAPGGAGGALRLAPLTRTTGTAKFDLLMSMMTDDQGGWQAHAEYATDLWDPASIDRLLGQFATLLAAAAAAPRDARLATLTLLSAAERQQLLAEWNDTASPSRRQDTEAPGASAAIGAPANAGLIGEVVPADLFRQPTVAALAPASAATGAERLHELVAAQVARTPNAVAVVGGDERLSYAALWASALRLAARLRGLGAGPDVRAGVCLGRTPDLITAFLGVLESGAAYVPLDPTLPPHRLQTMLKRAGATLLVADREHAARLDAERSFAGTLVLFGSDGRDAGDDRDDSERDVLHVAQGSLHAGTHDAAAVRRAVVASAGPVAGNSGGDRRPDAADTPLPGGGQASSELAYVIFTSGSTGEPKAVGIEHRGAVALVRWALGAFTRDELAGVLAATSVGFDLSIFEIFVPLSCGGQVILAPSIAELRQVRAIGGVTLVNTVPSPMAELVAAPLPPAVRTVNLAGEALDAELVARLAAHAQVQRVVNLYGPSESTTYATWDQVWSRRAKTAAAPGVIRVTIGRPVAGTTFRVFGRHGDLLPIGVPGELALGGQGLARGYLGRPDLTAERFVPDPCADLPGARLYRTGDRARLLPDGRLDFLGRLDQQVKVRGVRIEPGEIEAVLARHPQVAQAAVVARAAGGVADGPQLVAYVVAAATADSSGGPESAGDVAVMPAGVAIAADGTGAAGRDGELTAVLAAWLRERLPAAMVPAAWVVLPALPLSSNGKVDRRALPAPAAAVAGEAVAAGEAPRAGAEQALAAIWREVLGRDRIGRHEDFFAAGGHSLLALRAVFRIGEAFGVEVPVTALFQAPTVAALAAWLAAGAAGTAVGLSDMPGGAPPGTTGAVSALASVGTAAALAGARGEAPASGGSSAAALARLRLGGATLEEPAAAVAPDLAASSQAPEAPGAGAASRGLPLSAAQRRLWFLERLHPGQAGYELSVAVRLDGALSLPALAGSVAAVVERHEPLRTVYSESDGQPRQSVLAPPRRPLAMADLRGLAAGRRQAALRAAQGAVAARPFDLERGPVARFLLVALDEGAHVLCVACHHIAADGWSLEVLFRDLAALYGAALAGLPSPLPQPAPRYADHVLAQGRRVQHGDQLARQLAWWRGQLAGVPTLDLPLDRPRPARWSSRGVARRFELDERTASALGAVARSQGATPFMALLAGFFTFLARHSGQDDVAVGVPVAGRSHADAEGMVGLFVNTLVTRVSLADGPSFADLVRRVRHATLEAQQHQDLPFETLVEDLRPERASGASPLFQALFSHLAAAFGAVQMAGLELRLVPEESPTARFDLSCDVHQRDGRLGGNLDFAAALFEPATASRMRDHLLALLAAAAAAPQRPALELPMLSAAERHQVEVEWNHRAGDGITDATPLDHIVRQAAAAPGRRAVVCGGRELTYGELVQRSRRLADRLAALGVGGEDRVGLLLDRSAGVVVAMLATWQAGAAWVPFDPAAPPARLAALAADAGLAALIADPGSRPAPELGVPCLELVPDDLGRPAGRGRGQVAAPPAEPSIPASGSGATPGSGPAAGAGALSASPPTARTAARSPLPARPAPAPGDLAYLIYTSGTTGVPKAVAVAHGSLLQTLLAWQADYPLRPGDRVPVLAPLWFDTSVIELFAPLTAGGEMEMVPSLDILDLPRLVEVLSRATLAFQVPSLLRRVAAFLADPDGGRPALPPAGPRWLFPAGERVSGDLVRELQQTFPATRVMASYGPTETAVTCATWSPPRPLVEGDEGGVLGRPLTGVTLLVRDCWGNPAPIGVAGELHIGGGGVARGYLGRPRLTADRFRPAPGGGRSYRSGDLTRLLGDGRIQFLGRIDHQIKLRGFRIEPGEIEVALRAQEGVLDALVTVVAAAPAAGRGLGEAPGGDLRLTAYVVPDAPAALADGARQQLLDRLRRRLAERLPDYMVPAAWVLLAAFPLSATGKVDRRALPAPAPDAAALDGLDAAAAAARTPEEELLAALWAEVLGLERVGPASDFFALGGHSLLLTQLASRVRRAFGVEVPLADLFAARTLAEQALRLGELLRQQAAPAAGPPAAQPVELPPIPPLRPLPPAARRQPLPLSFAQERLWLLATLEPGPLYNMPVAARLRGDLLLPALAAALGGIVRRHEVLRTRLVAERGRPAQIVVPHQPRQAARLPLVDLSALPAALGAPAARALLDAEARRPFDLESGRLVRSLVLRLGPADHQLVVVLHHIAADGWSMGVLLDELAVLYTAAAGAGPGLPELPVQYADFAVWQRQWLAGDRLARELAHWRQRLAGAPETLELPADRPRRPDGAAHGGQRSFAMPAGTRGHLALLARRRGWTPFMPLLAAFAALLARWGGRRDAGEVVIGSPIANRNVLETERLIGFFANTLALRLDLEGDPAFALLADRARSVCLDAYAHQDLPFEKLVEELAPVRQAGTTPLFNVMLVLQNVPLRLAVPGLAVELLDAGSGTAKFDLAVFLMESGGELLGSIEFRRDLFDDATIERLTGHLRTLLAGAIAAPAARLSELPLLSPAERSHLALQAAAPPAAIAASLAAGRRLAHLRVADQAARTPDAVAAVFADSHLSYGELAARSRRLAGQLRRLGVGPDVVVGLYVERSLEAMTALLGIMAAGGAFLALDPDSPVERLRLMLDDARAPVIVTQALLADQLPAGGTGAARLVVVDRPAHDPRDAADRDAAAATPLPAPPRGDRLLADHLIYVCYTSGSTGRPKGVAMPHGALAAMLDWQLRTSHAADRTLNFTSLSFDVSFQELFATWSAGGTLVLIGEEVRRDPAALASLLARQQVTRLFLPFVALQQLAVAAVAAPPQGFPGALREVLSAGEQLYVTPQVAALAARLPGAALYNHYGPTEAHAVTWLPLTGDPAAWPERPSIGGPLDHARILLLDRNLRRVPQGVPGEVWAAGPGLARGYLGRRRLTAERFMPDPFADVPGWRPGARMYRVGDVARQLADGTLEFLGRTDFQVKVRGHRIEVAEIETALARHPAVSQAAVVAHGEDAASRRLVACVVCAPQVTAPTAADLRAWLGRTLPAAMVPSGWLRAARLPLTATGKLDRRALERWAGGAFAAPDPAAAAAAGYDVAPLDATAGGAAADAAGAADQGPAASLRHPAEELMAGIWREVLGAVEVAAADDFFALGGHSLLATQVVSRIREVFGVELPLRRLFEEPTVAAMTGAVLALRAVGANGANGAGDGGDDPAVAAPPIVRAARDRPLPLSFAQERLWFLDRLQPGGSAYNLPLLLRASGPLAPARLAAALSRVVRRHEVLRTRYAEQDGRPVQIVDDAAPVAVPVADLAALPADRRQEEARRLVAAAAGQPFDLARGPVLRVLMVASGQDGPLLLATLHHIAADGWSMGVLVREMQAAWAARPATPPPPLAVQYADFAVWQRQWLAGAPLARQLGWWRKQLHGARAVLEVPADRPRPPVATQRGAEHVFALDAGLAARLAAAASRHGATLFMALAGGLYALLARLSGERDLILGTPIANRNRIQIEPLIGCFVNMLALRVQVDGEAAWGDLLAAVRETSLGAYAHQDLPFEMLVDQVAPQRDLSRPPLVQVAMALQNAPLPVADLDGVRLTSHEPGSGTAKLDLTWSFAAGAEGRLDATLQYAADLFDAATAARLAHRFGVLLDELLSRPLARVAAAALLAPAERHQLLHEWNDTAAPPLPAWGDRAVAPAVHHQVERHAALRPQALAVCRGAQRLTYGELNAQADHLAWQLRRAGAGQDAPVALWLERSPELVVAALAALKAGAAYLPLDPAWPAARVQAILDQARVRVLVAGGEQPALAGAARADAADADAADAAGDGGSSRRGVRRLDVREALTPPAAGEPARRVPGPPPAVVLPGTLAYVIYTSGSTGEPKGVEVSHGALAGMVRWNATTYGWGAGERGTMLATPSFDASVFEIWPVLASGASLHVPEAEVRLVPERLLAWLASEGITVSFLPTALAEQVVEAAERALPAGDMRLRTLLSGGDRLRRPPVRPLPFAMVNLYGPAESTVVSTVGACSVVPSGGGEPSIGRPVDDTRIYLADAAGELVAPGVPGEMYLAGRGLARGYLGRPDLTAERFLPDPWSGHAGGRLYRTGDVARHAPIGDLHFLGRVDAQVKVRGCRIEPAEIEAALRRHPGVRQAAVVPRRQPSGEMQLVGYVVFAPPMDLAAPVVDGVPPADPAAGEPAAAAAPAQLRALLAAELPEYMVPAVLVELPELPVTPNGKLDRAALPAPPDRQEATASFTAPRNDRERIVADAWREVLGRERIGVDESFFAVGGSSLAMVQLQSRLRSALGREVPLLELFRHPTIEGLAASLGQDAAATADAAAGAAEQARARVATRRESLRRQQVRRRAPGAAAAPGDRAKAGDNHD